MPSSRRICSVWPSGLRDVAVANNASADAELAQTIAGRARWLYEHATGGPAVAGDSPLVPRNPQGLYGHDHSGPPYGSAFKHPLFSFAGSDNDTDWTSHRNVFTIRGVNENLGGYSDAPKSLVIERDVWIRPFAAYRGAPYSEATVHLLMKARDATSTVTIGASTNGGPLKLSAPVVTTTMGIFALSDPIDLKPGRNRVRFEFSVSGDKAVDLLALAASQTVKRSHL